MELEIILSIIFGIFSVVATILSIVFDRNTAKQDKIKRILEKVPDIISNIELCVGAKNGVFKKRLAISDIRNECFKIGLKWTEKLEKLFDNNIESVLTTPQKKINVDEKESQQNGEQR